MTIYTATEARTAVQTYNTNIGTGADLALGTKYSELFTRIRTESAKGIGAIGIYTTEMVYMELRPFLVKYGYTVYQIPSSSSTKGIAFPLPASTKTNTILTLYNNGTPTVISWGSTPTVGTTIGGITYTF